ncbi:MAG: FAD-dependent oxidoreductase [Anaerolineales bacterium]|nr:FAD-dependent oxidoreductase [Anaerolineales bacterium]
MRNYVIIGIGPAGIAAAQAVRGQDAGANILLVGDESFGYYSRPGLAYYLTGEIPEKGLYPFTQKEFQKFGFRLIHARVAAIHPLEHQIENQSGKRLAYDRLLIATGASAVQIKIPGIDLAGVVKLDNLEDARHVLKLARGTRSAVVVGGGITALEMVEGLVSRGVRVHYFLRGDRYWSNVLDETESRIVESRLREEGVKIHRHTELANILGTRGRVSGVITKNGEQIRCQMVAVAIGIRPRTRLAVAAGLNVERGIMVNEYLQTTAADIYAAGDVAQVYDPRSGVSVVDSLWGPARAQGHHAGLNMAGITIPYIKEVPFNVTRLAGLTTTIVGTVGRGLDADLVGIARGDSETWRQLPDAIAAQSDFDVNRLRIMVGQQHLLGAIVMGDQTLSQPLHRLISQSVDITPIRDQLLDVTVKLGDLIANFWTEWRSSNAA